MRRTAPMVLAVGFLLFGSAFALAFQAEPGKPTGKPEKSTHKSEKSYTKAGKSIPKSGKSIHSAPASSASKAHPAVSRAASRTASSPKTAITRASSSRAAAKEADTRLSDAHQPAHGLATSAFPSRATNGRYASSRAGTGRYAGSRAITGGSGRRTAQARSAVLTSRSRLRASIRERELAASPAPEPESISLHRRDLGLPPPLFGSHASLERQNERSEGEDGLERIQDEEDLQDRIGHNFLVPVPASPDLSVNQNLAESHRYCRPWTAQFLADLARQHAALFHRPLEVSSAVRTVDYQKQLERVNGNAAAAEGDVASPHLTGAAIDIPKSNMTRDEIAWMRNSLLALQQAGKLDVEEEFKQSCFHIDVYRSYAIAPTAPAPTLAPAPALVAVDSPVKPVVPHRRSSIPASRRSRAANRPSVHAPVPPAKPLPA